MEKTPLVKQRSLVNGTIPLIRYEEDGKLSSNPPPETCTTEKGDQLSYTFQIEDNSDGSYRDFTSALILKGWSSYDKKNKTKFERRRFPIRRLNDVPKFIWTINEKNSNFYSELLSDQIVNHYEGINVITKKNRFCELLRDLHWINIDSNDITPRCYNLGDSLQRNEFIEDFKISAVIAILAEWMQCIRFQDPFPYKIQLVVQCVSILIFALNSNQSKFLNSSHSSKSHLKSSVNHTRTLISYDSSLPSLPDSLWDEIMNTSASICSSSSSHLTSLSTLTLSDMKEILSSDPTSRSSSGSGTGGSRSVPVLFLQVVYHLYLYQSQYPSQSYLSGYQNIWIVKAPEASKGTNIKLFTSLIDILLYEKGMSGRIVQKYIERPLLIPPLSRFISPKDDLSYHNLLENSKFVKFDLRIWVLITSFNSESLPRVYLYNEVYGRRCSTPFDLTASSLNDLYKHLTNFSIQKNRINDADDDYCLDGKDHDSTSSSTTSTSRGTLQDGLKILTSKVSQLRSTVQNYRNSNSRPILSSSDLLVTHQELMLYLSYIQRTDRKWHKNYNFSSKIIEEDDDNSNQPYLWNQCIWPQIKRKIFALISMTQTEIINRENTFEFLGVDVLLDDQCDPWILEVNLTPGLSHRNSLHNQYIERMANELIETVLADFHVIPASNTVEKKWEIVQHESIGSSSSSSSSSSIPSSTGVLSSEEFILRTYYSHLYTSSGPLAPIRAPTFQYQPQGRTSQHRPRSASASFQRKLYTTPNTTLIPSTTSSSTTTFQANTTSQLEMTCTLLGVGINRSQIAFQDLCCDKFMSLLLIQRWFRRYQIRCHLYYARRIYCSLIIQCSYRCYRSRCVFLSIKQENATILLQCSWRQYLARRKRQFLYETKAAIQLQAIARCYLAKLRRYHLFRVSKILLIQRWIRRIFYEWKTKACKKIIRIVKPWYRRRYLASLKIQQLWAQYYQILMKSSLIITRFIKKSLTRWMKYIQSYKQLLSQIAHECILLAKEWLRRYEERISREEERKKQLEKEKEYELQQRYLEEEEKKIRGYRRMDRIYAMWKEVFVEDTSTGTEGTSLSNEMKISQKEGEANIKNLSSQLLRINQPGSEFRKTENFSLEDFISKHDQEDDDQDHDHDQSQGLGHHQHTSNVLNEKKSTLQHDGWINFRSNTSTTSSPPPSSISKTDQSPGNMSSIDSQAHTITSTHIKKSKEKRKSEHNKRKSTSSGRSSTPTSTCSSRKNENRVSHTQPKNQTLTKTISPENDVFHLSPRVDSIPFEEENIPASLLIPDVLEDHPTRSTSTGRRICLKKCGCHINEICLCRPLPSPPSPSSAVNVVQINQELENKINNIYSEYDGELQAIWKKMTEQKKKSIRHRPHSANLSKVNDPNSVHVPQVDFIYGYGYQNFQEEESLINYERAGDNPSTIDGHHSLPVHSQKKISRPRSASSHYQKKSPRNSTRHSSRSEKQEIRPDTGRSIKYDRYNFEDDDHY